ncbi:hypothetical protein V1477_015693 [Vespula maculifrons]|uniref:Uncharacterized protein n=1 Tax=Vespula maculifrons TaxID=7453 RepID=A0ABD2BAX2_VESMC
MRHTPYTTAVIGKVDLAISSSRSYTIEGEYRPIESKWHYVGRDIRLTSTISYGMSSPIQKVTFYMKRLD